jgi:hypothetical protein
MITSTGEDWTAWRKVSRFLNDHGIPRKGQIGSYCMPALSTELGESHPRIFGTITFPDGVEFDIDFYVKWRHSPYHSFKDTRKEELESLWSV